MKKIIQSVPKSTLHVVYDLYDENVDHLRVRSVDLESVDTSTVLPGFIHADTAPLHGLV